VAVYFFDSSALVKRYVSETGSAWVVSVLDSAAGNRIHPVRSTGVEVVSAVARRQRGGSVSPADAAAIFAQVAHDFAAEYRVVELTPALITRAMALAQTHGLRAYDAVQLAAALALNSERLSRGMSALTLVSADTDLNAAAAAEGLTTEDPNAHP